MKPILIGEAPSKSGDRYHSFPLSGAVAERMCRLAGIAPQSEGTRYGRWTWALYDVFECHNVFERYADATPWKPAKALGRVEELYEEICGDDGSVMRERVIVGLGRKVQAALGVPPEIEFYEWTDNDDMGRVCIVPHPSGLNRLLNSEENRQKFGESLREAMEYARHMTSGD